MQRKQLNACHAKYTPGVARACITCMNSGTRRHAANEREKKREILLDSPTDATQSLNVEISRLRWEHRGGFEPYDSGLKFPSKLQINQSCHTMYKWAQRERYNTSKCPVQKAPEIERKELENCDSTVSQANDVDRHVFKYILQCIRGWISFRYSIRIGFLKYNYEAKSIRQQSSSRAEVCLACHKRYSQPKPSQNPPRQID